MHLLDSLDFGANRGEHAAQAGLGLHRENRLADMEMTRRSWQIPIVGSIVVTHDAATSRIHQLQRVRQQSRQIFKFQPQIDVQAAITRKPKPSEKQPRLVRLRHSENNLTWTDIFQKAFPTFHEGPSPGHSVELYAQLFRHVAVKLPRHDVVVA